MHITGILFIIMAALQGQSESNSLKYSPDQSFQWEQIKKAVGKNLKEASTNRKVQEEKPFPPVPERSQYLSKLDQNPHPKGEVPEIAPHFRWDLSSEGRIHSYNYMQENEIHYMMGGITRDRSLQVNGSLQVKSRKERKATLVFDIQKAKMKSGNDREWTELPALTQQPVLIQGMEEDGKIGGKVASGNELFGVLLQLPSKPLKVGESTEVELSMPVNALGSTFVATGTGKITLLGYFLIGDHLCAGLSTDVDISQLNVPPEFKGTIAVTLRGKINSYFDVADRTMNSSQAALLMTMRVDTPQMRVAIDNDTIITYKTAE